MDRIKQSHLRVFAAVAALGGVTLAARKLNRSPSAVSMTLSQLEAELGQALFEPEGRSRLTPFGRYVHAVTRHEIDRYDRSIEGIRAVARNELGRVDIAAVPSFAAVYLPGVLNRFLARYPNVGLSIRDDNTAGIVQLVERGAIDVGIASPVEPTGPIRFEPLLTDPIGVVCAAGHPLAGLARPLRWDDLAPFVFISNGTCGLIRDPRFRKILESSGIDVRNTTSLLALISAGVGITTLPRLTIPQERRDVVFKPAAYPDAQRTIGIVTPTNRTLPPAAAGFIDTLRQAIPRQVVKAAPPGSA